MGIGGKGAFTDLSCFGCHMSGCLLEIVSAAEEDLAGRRAFALSQAPDKGCEFDCVALAGKDGDLM